MRTEKLVIRSVEELPAAAARLLDFAKDKRLIAFFGEMGSGKTTFIVALCKVLNVIGVVSSPTFALINEYITTGDELIYHFDFYRIKSEQEAVDIGIDEYFYSGNYCLVEWPENILNLLPKEIVKVSIDVVNEIRYITFQDE